MQCIASFCCSLDVPVGYLSVYIGFCTTTWVFSIAVSPRDYQSHSPPSVFVQFASKEVMATTAARHVAPAAVLQIRATLSTERVLVLLTTGKHQCVQVRQFWRIYNRVLMVMCTCILSFLISELGQKQLHVASFQIWIFVSNACGTVLCFYWRGEHTGQSPWSSV